jgi:hypothetical protein
MPTAGYTLVVMIKLIPLITGIRYWWSLTLPYKLTLIQVGIAIIFELAGWTIAHYWHQHNLWLFNCFHVIELWIMGMAGYFLFQSMAIKRNVILLLLLGTGIWTFTIIATGIFVFSTLCLVSLALILDIIYLVILIKTGLSGDERIQGKPVFWLRLSVIIYYSCNIPYYGLFNYLYKHNPHLHKLLFDVIIFNLNYIRYPFIALSFYLLGRKVAAPALKSV